VRFVVANSEKDVANPLHYGLAVREERMTDALIC
jgi:hypothetical protein